MSPPFTFDGMCVTMAHAADAVKRDDGPRAGDSMHLTTTEITELTEKHTQLVSVASVRSVVVFTRRG